MNQPRLGFILLPPIARGIPINHLEYSHKWVVKTSPNSRFRHSVYHIWRDFPRLIHSLGDFPDEVSEVSCSWDFPSVLSDEMWGVNFHDEILAIVAFLRQWLTWSKLVPPWKLQACGMCQLGPNRYTMSTFEVRICSKMFKGVYVMTWSKFMTQDYLENVHVLKSACKVLLFDTSPCTVWTLGLQLLH